MLKINSGKVTMYDIDITDQPMLRWTTADGKSILKPSVTEDTRIVVTNDGDRALYEVFFRDEFIGICGTREKAEQMIDEYEQRHYDLYNSDEEDELYMDE